VLELTGRLLGEAGESLRPGDRVICGVIGAPLPAAPGDDVTVEFGQLGRLNVRIAD
jgi:2-keto-4-pentenoate hydratase